MLFVMGNGTTLAHCQHNGQTWFWSFVDDECETEDDCCDDNQEDEDECVETVNLDIVSPAVSNASDNIFQIPVFSLQSSVVAVMPDCSESLTKRDAEWRILTCGPPRSTLYRICVLRL